MKAFVRTLILFFLVFAIAGAGGYVFITLFTRSAEEVVLPELRGKNILYVLETLTRLGLNTKLLGTRFDPDVPEYGITFQDPAPGARIKKGRDVMIYISKGREEIILPDVRQLTRAQADLTLEGMGLSPAVLSFVHSGETRKDHVMAQVPLPFSLSLKHSVCRLLISKGPAEVPLVMPDLTDMPLADAVHVLEKMDLNPASIQSKNAPEIRPGLVLAQTPEFGSPVFPQSKIELVASHSQEKIQMDPKALSGVILVRYPLRPGFLNRHVRVELTMEDLTLDLYNEYFSPENDINILIPSGIKTMIKIFLDQELVKTTLLDPWTKEPEFLFQTDDRPYPWTRMLNSGEYPWD